MKKVYYSICIVVLSLTVLFPDVAAQDKKVEIGLKGGVNLSKMRGDFVEHTQWIFGFNAGVTVDYAFTDALYLQTGLELTSKGVEENALIRIGEGASGTTAVGHSTYRPLYLQLPVHLAYKMRLGGKAKAFVYAGPYMAYGVSGKIKASLSGLYLRPPKTYEEIDMFGKEGVCERFDFGVGAGVGLEIMQFGLKAGYDHGLVNLLKKNQYIKAFGIMAPVDNSLKVNTMNFYASLGYRF